MRLILWDGFKGRISGVGQGVTLGKYDMSRKGIRKIEKTLEYNLQTLSKW